MQEAPMGASCVLPRKVGKKVWVSVEFSFEAVVYKEARIVSYKGCSDMGILYYVAAV